MTGIGHVPVDFFETPTVTAGSHVGYTQVSYIYRVPTLLSGMKHIACGIIKVKGSGGGENLLNLRSFTFIFTCFVSPFLVLVMHFNAF